VGAGAKVISIPPAPVIRFDMASGPDRTAFALYVGDVIQFGGDNNRYVVTKIGDPVTFEGTQFESEGRWKAHLESPMHQLP
jgi:hypothetical protein